MAYRVGEIAGDISRIVQQQRQGGVVGLVIHGAKGAGKTRTLREVRSALSETIPSLELFGSQLCFQPLNFPSRVEVVVIDNADQWPALSSNAVVEFSRLLRKGNHSIKVLLVSCAQCIGTWWEECTDFVFSYEAQPLPSRLVEKLIGGPPSSFGRHHGDTFRQLLLAKYLPDDQHLLQENHVLIVGYHDALTRLKNMVSLYLNLAENDAMNTILSRTTGILLHGPSGCGKSLALQWLQTCCFPETAFINVSAGRLFSKYVGESEENLRRVFQTARQTNNSIILIEDIDLIACSRAHHEGGKIDVNVRILSSLLCEMDGLQETRPLVIATTNKLGFIDAALLRQGRLETHIYLGVLTAEDAGALVLQLTAGWTSKEPTSSDVNALQKELIEWAADRTPAQVVTRIRHIAEALIKEGCISANGDICFS